MQINYRVTAVMPKLEIVLGFDFGLRYIGVALGQVKTRTAQALTTVLARQGTPDWQQIDALFKLWQPDALVLGIPVNMDDSEQVITRAAKQFSMQLTQRLNRPIYWVDERLSTVEASARLFALGGAKALRKKSINSVAARLIVETWLYSLPEF